MSQSDSGFLIDLTTEDAGDAAPPGLVRPEPVLHVHNATTPGNREKRNSLDNNPFDSLSKQVNLPNDPFEMLSQKAERHSRSSDDCCGVETENLLGLDVDLGCEATATKTKENIQRLKTSHRSGCFSTNGSASSLSPCYSPTVYDDSVFNSNVSPIWQSSSTASAGLSTLNKAFMEGSSLSDLCTTAADVSGNNSSKVRPPLTRSENYDEDDYTSPRSGSLTGENRKLSSGRSALNVAHCSSSIRTHLLKLSVSSSPAGSPFLCSSKGSQDNGNKRSAINETSRSIACELSDSCDDINATKPNWVDSETETEQDSDLELLSIPMLKKFESEGEVERALFAVRDESVPDTLASTHNEQAETEKGAPEDASNGFDLKALRETVRRHKMSSNDSRDVDDLIKSLKQAFSECSDQQQKFEANKLLEGLSTLIRKDTDKVECSEAEKVETPPFIIRQHTFDLDDSNKLECNDGASKPAPTPSQSFGEEGSRVSSNVSLEVSHIAEHLSKLLGNQNVNVLQTTLDQANIPGTNPTYIVVMGAPTLPPPSTPVRQNTQILINSTTSPEFTPETRRRSYSLSLHDKPPRRQTANVPDSTGVLTTPTRSNAPKRRSSISYSSAPSTTQSQMRRSVYESSTTQKQPSTVQRRQSLNGQRVFASAKALPKHIPSVASDLNARTLRLKSSGSSQRTMGPLKATIPIKRVMPMVVTQSISSPIENVKSKLLTSTPIPYTNSLTAFPVACSTPSSNSPPRPSKNTARSKYDSPYLSVTPNPKVSMKLAASKLNRRRSLTDRPNSPRRSMMNRSPNRTSANTSQAANSLNNVHTYVSSKSEANVGFVAPRNKENTCPK